MAISNALAKIKLAHIFGSMHLPCIPHISYIASYNNQISQIIPSVEQNLQGYDLEIFPLVQYGHKFQLLKES